MASVTLHPGADLATTSSGLAAGAGPHLPIGTWSGTRYRSAIRFQNPSWGSWTSITKATLSFNISDHQHVGVRNSDIRLKRQAMSGLWTGGSGSQNCNSGFSSSNTSQYDDIDPTTTDQVIFSSGTTANARKSVVITNLVRYYFDNNAGQLVFVFDQDTSSDYTELWSSLDAASGYEMDLVIEYETAAPPTAPTLLYPAQAQTIVETQPLLDWQHNDPQGDAQAQANVQIWDAAGTTLLYTWNQPTSTTNLLAPIALTRGTSYKFSVQTSDATGWGPYSTKRDFTIKALPVVTISTVRSMTFDAVNHQPRLVVNWTCDQPQASVRIQTASGYDSGSIPGSVQTHVIARNLTSGTAETVTVTVTTADPLSGSASQAFTPRWGLTTHRRDLTTAPLNWGSPVINATTPAGTSLVIEYGSDAGIVTTPGSGWLPDLSSVPKNRYVYWRAWLIPSATVGPTLDKIVIPSDSTATLVDKWGTTRDAPGLTGVWAIDPGEAVYGTRSMRADVTGAGPFLAYSYGVKVRAGRSYVLTGLMKSSGNSGAQFRLEDGAGNILQGGGIVLPTGNVESPKITATGITDWFNASKNDTVRYKTPIYVAPSDMTVYVVLVAGGTNGSKAWFDAIKLEESTVATPWSPGAIGAVVIDAGGVQVDGTRGGVFRLKGSGGAVSDIVELGPNGLMAQGSLLLPAPYVGTSPPASPASGQLWWDTDDVGSSPGGSAFPVSPATFDRFWRTDLGMEFFWDGARWLSSQIFESTGGNYAPSATYSVSQGTSGASIHRTSLYQGNVGSDIWLMDVGLIPFVNTGGTALSGSHSWEMQIQKINLANVATLLGSYLLNSGASGTWRPGAVVLNQLLGTYAAFPYLRLDLVMVGTPGTIIVTVPEKVRYRIVG